MNVAQYINECYKTGNKEGLVKAKDQLQKNLSELEVFFDEYLEVFDDQMSATMDKTTQVWKAYNDHYKSYENVKNQIKMTDYYLGIM
jgi:hypothetical protein